METCRVITDNIHSMILFRVLQGALGASMIPIVFTSSLHYFQGPRRVCSAAVVGSIASVAPSLGPIVGGWITDTWDWHWLFYVDLAPGIAITLLTPLVVDIDKPDLRLLKDADYPGIALMAISLGTLEYVLERRTFNSGARRSDLCRNGNAGAELLLLDRAVRAKGHAEGHRRQAQCSSSGGDCRYRGEIAAR
jgi:MFS family permease